MCSDSTPRAVPLRNTQRSHEPQVRTWLSMLALSTGAKWPRLMKHMQKVATRTDVGLDP